MDEDMIRQVTRLERRLAGLARPEVSVSSVVASFLNIPGLVGLWPMSSVQRSTGNAYDVSGQGRTLTYNGNPTYNIHNNVVPYADLDGTGDYLHRADETDLDVLGTETIYNSSLRGVTIGGWFWVDDPSTGNQRLVTKGTTTGNDRAYGLLSQTNGINFLMSSNGTDSNGAGPIAVSAATWFFAVGRFTPSSEIRTFVNADTDFNNTAIAALNNAAGGLALGAQSDGTQNLDGRISICFLSGNALPNSIISALFQQSRPLFGV
jgi:hypothetical protein